MLPFVQESPACASRRHEGFRLPWRAKAATLLLAAAALIALAPAASAETASGPLKQYYSDQGNVYVVLDGVANSCGSNRYVILAANPSRETMKTRLGMNAMPPLAPRALSIDTNGCSAGAAIVVDLSAVN